MNLNSASINDDIRALFDLVYQGRLPDDIIHFFSDGYLFCLYKDLEDKTKLRPIIIPTALRRIIASHINIAYRQRFALRLLPHNLALGIDGGMDFVVKTTQLQIEKYIQRPQESNPPQLPSRLVIFLDLINMFNRVSREELMHIISEEFPELLPLARLLYGRSVNVHHRWEDGSWRMIDMSEGLSQGCPLSILFAALVLDRVIRPLDGMLRERAAARLANGDEGDDGYGSVTHTQAYVDDGRWYILRAPCGCEILHDKLCAASQAPRL